MKFMSRAIAAGLLVLASTPAFAVRPPDKGRTLGEKEFFRPDLYIGVQHERLETVLGALPNKSAWEQFVASRGGDVSVYLDNRSGAAASIIAPIPLIPGAGVGNDVTLASLGAQLGRRVEQVDEAVVGGAVLAFARAHQAILGIDASQLGEPRVTRVTEDLWQVHIPQQVGKVPVRHGRLAATISHGNMILIGAETWGNASVDVSNAIPMERAVAEGFAYAEGPTAEDVMVSAPALEIIPFAPAEYQNGELYGGPRGAGYGHRLAWVFSFRRAGDGATWELKVDAKTAEVLSLEDTNQYATVKGGVYPVTSTEICPNPGTCGIMQPQTPMPFADTGLAAPNNFTNSAGVFTFPGGTATSTLVGRYIRITDTCGAPSLSTTTGTIDFGGTNGQHDCTFGNGNSTAAARSGFYELNKIAEMGRGYLPANTWLTQQLTSNMNLNATCNAFWSGTVNFYRSGGGCRNTGEVAGVFDHEWGHGLDDNDANGTLSNSSEGYADIAAIYRYQDSCVGHGFFWTLNDGCGMTADGTGFNVDEAQTGRAALRHQLLGRP